MKLFKIIKRLSKRQQILYVTFAAVIILGVGFFIWAVITGKIRPFAAGNQITNTATVSWLDSGGVTHTQNSNTVITDVTTPTPEPSPSPSANPYLIEAESMTLTNFHIEPYSWASGGNVIALYPQTAGLIGTATTNYGGTTGTYDIKVTYNDESDGIAIYKLYVNSSLVDQWNADLNLGITNPQLGNLVSHTKSGVVVANGNQIKLEITNVGGEWGRTDKIELIAATPTPEPSPSSSPTGTTINLSLNLQGRTNYTTSGTSLIVCNPGQCPALGQTTPTPVLIKNDIATDSAGNSTFTVNLPSGTYDFRIQVNGYLTKIITNQTLSNPLSLAYTDLRAGDINGDNFVNSVDFAMLNAKWNQSDPVADINGDGIVNSVDFSLLNSNWFSQGQ